jgi:hypothetical protein
MDWTQLITGLANVGAGIYGAEQNQNAAESAARMAAINPYSISSPYGGVSVNGRNLTLTPGNTPFGQLAQQVGTAGMANYGFTTNDPYAALPDEFKQAAAAFDSPLSYGVRSNQDTAASYFNALNSLGADPQAAARNRYNLLTQAAQPEQNRMFNSLQDKLFAQGRLGTSGGGEAMRGFFESQNAADLQRQLASQDFAMNQQSHLAGLAQGFNSAAQGSAATRFNLASGLLNAGDNRRQNIFNNAVTAQGQYQNMFNPLVSMAQLGISAGGGNPAGAQLMYDASAARNNAYVQAAGQILPALGQWVGGRTQTPQQPPANSEWIG